MSTQPAWRPRWLWPVVIVLAVVNLGFDAAVAGGALFAVGRARAVRQAATAAGQGSTPSTGPESFTPPPKPAAAPVVLPRTCLSGADDHTGAHIPDSSPYSHSMSDISPGGRLVRLYAVTAGRLVPMDGAGAPRSCDELIFQAVRELAPANALAALDELLVFDTPLTADSFDPGDVFPDPNRLGHFRMTISVNGTTDPVQLRYALAHDVGRLIAENLSAVTSSDSSRGCAWNFPGECVRNGSFFGDYLTTFWDTPLGDSWLSSVGEAEGSSFTQAADSFYTAHRNDFVTEFAVNDPAQDFAESFSFWCGLTPNDPARSGFTSDPSSLAEKKIQWFDTGSALGADMAAPCARLRTLQIAPTTV